MSQLPPSFRVALIVPDGAVGHMLRVAQTLGALVETCDMIDPPHAEKVKQLSPKKGNRVTGVGKAVVAFITNSPHPVTKEEIGDALSSFNPDSVRRAIYTEIKLGSIRRNPDKTYTKGVK